MFASGRTLEAVEAVCTDTDAAPDDVVDAVVQLVRKSRVLNIGDERYRQLETLREYALDRQRDPGGLSAPREQHARYYSQLVERLDPAGSTRLLSPPHDARAPRRIETLGRGAGRCARGAAVLARDGAGDRRPGSWSCAGSTVAGPGSTAGRPALGRKQGWAGPAQYWRRSPDYDRYRQAFDLLVGRGARMQHAC